MDAPVSTEPGCRHAECKLDHPHDGPAVLQLPVKDMTDRELLEECVETMRHVGAALAAFQQMGPGGIMKMMLGSGKAK